MFDKNVDKNIRVPIDGKANENSKAVRPSLSRNMKLDSTFYEEDAPHMKHMKINDLDGDVQWWIDRGAKPVERKSEQRTIYKGLNDKGDSEYVCWHGGESDGTPFKVWLLRMSPEDYQHYKTGPEEQRQKDIHNSMYRNAGKDPTGNSQGAQTYAPNLPDGSGKQGFNQIRD